MRISRLAAVIATALVVMASTGCRATSTGMQSVNQAGSVVANAAPGAKSILQPEMGISRPITESFEGTNLDFTGVAEPYGQTSVRNAVTSLRPGTIRYPGGAIANYWDWQTGSVDEPASTSATAAGRTKFKPGKHQTYGFTLSTLEQLTTMTGAVPIFDLNVMTSTLADQLQMLQTAARLGLPIRYVELGNEFYLSNSNYLHAFPTPASYANLVATWAPAIHAEFPSAQVAAVATLSTATPREQTWNATLLDIAGSDINAVTLHDYPSNPTPGNTLPSPSTLLAAASLEWQPVDAIINALPSHLSVWLTEYNLGLVDRALGSPPLGSTWEHALYVAQLDEEELASPRVALTDYWDLFGNAIDAQFTTAVPPVATPTGTATQLIDQAMIGATKITEFTFANDPVLDGSAKSVSGFEVTSASGGTRLVFVNLGSNSAALATSSVIPRGASARQLSGSLSNQEVHVRFFNTASHLTLPPYSITVATG